MDRRDLILLIILLALTASSYLASGSPNQTVWIILAITAVKFISVAFQYMEMKHAHRFWQAALVFLLALYAVLVGFGI